MRLASSCFGSIPKFNGKCSLVIINDNEKQSIKLNAKFNYIIINKKHSKKTNGGAILKIKKKFLKKVFKTLTTLFFSLHWYGHQGEYSKRINFNKWRSGQDSNLRQVA